MSDIKKFLDYEGVQHLWSKINMNDYPNNETLMAVINAIDEIFNMYLLNINYDIALGFDTSEIVFENTSTTSILGQAILGQMRLA